MKGSQLIAAIEKSLDPELMNSYHKVFRGAPVARPVVSGMTIKYAPDAPHGLRVQEIMVNGQPLDPERTYRVAHTDAEVIEDGAPIGYFKLEDDQILKIEVPTIVREVIEDYMQVHSPTPKPQGGRWIKI
ncbi:MAG: hypothetical protein HGA53_03310, partial [Anaerolineaceae bacterium]|nr:hypothetical protein [Anaerolineaceae bacterium]